MPWLRRQLIFSVVSLCDGVRVRLCFCVSLQARRYEIFSAALLVFTVFVDVLDSVNSFHISHTKNKWLFAAFEKFVVFVFTLEYVLRLWSCVEDDRYRPRGCLKEEYVFRLKYYPALDLLVLVVFYIDMCVSHDVRGLTTFRLIRVLRVLAVLKMERQIQSFGMIHKVLKMKKAELCATLFLAAVLLLMASCAMYYIENPSQPASFSSIPATMWWTVTALTTVGYGDIYPRTACGKILGSCVAFFGIGLFALPAGIISSGFVEVIEEKHQAECDELADMIGEDGTYLQELRDEVSTLNCTIQQMQRELREERGLNQARASWCVGRDISVLYKFPSKKICERAVIWCWPSRCRRMLEVFAKTVSCLQDQTECEFGPPFQTFWSG